MAKPDAPLLLEGTTGLGKTRAYLSAVMQAAESGKRIAIALPSHQLIDQLLSSSDLAVTELGGVSVMAFKPASFFENRKAYTEHKDSVLRSDVMLCIQSVSKLSNTIEPIKHGKLHFHVSDLEVDTPEWLGIVQKTVDEAMRPTLIVTPSHELAQTLGSVMPNAVVRHTEETTSEAASRMGKADVLIAAGAWAGLDTSVRWASVVIPKIPFEKPVILDGHQESHFLNSRNTAVRRMRQVLGRGLRSPDAECSVYILDGRSKAIESFVPKRFSSQWADKGVLEGSRVEVTLSKLERDPTVRKKALSYYGQDCLACGFKPKHISQIDVHHLLPLSEGGERLTSITDVAVLCATCHRLAHSTKPPMTVEAMKVVNAKI